MVIDVSLMLGNGCNKLLENTVQTLPRHLISSSSSFCGTIPIRMDYQTTCLVSMIADYQLFISLMYPITFRITVIRRRRCERLDTMRRIDNSLSIDFDETAVWCSFSASHEE